MLSYVTAKSNTFKTVVFAGLFTVPLALWLGTTAYAVDTEIGAIVCGGSAPAASISISEPMSDSVVNQPLITIRGTTRNASQIEIKVDGQYSGTATIGINQTEFETDVSLSTGTHTITAKANGICGTAPAEASIVVTYRPEVEPSSGSTTSTTVGAEGEETQTGISAERPIGQNDIAQQIEQFPLIGAAVGVVSDIAASIGLGATFGSSNANIVVGTTRVGMTVVALTSVVMASSIAPAAAGAVPGISEAFNVNSHRSMMYLGWLIRGAGILTMAIVYFI